MKKPALALLASALILVPAGLAGADDAASKKDIVDTAVSAGSFKTLVAAVQAAGLEDALRSDGPFTVFAPTDEAFAELPEGTVANLLKPENRETLKRILTYHVVSGRVLSNDLLAAKSAQTLAGETLPIRLRVGYANVVQTDIETSNGVIHVIDSVLLPPARKETGKMQTPAEQNVAAMLHDAIDRGVPVFNSGDHSGCARIYRETAKRLAASGDVPDLDRMELRDALAASAHETADEAWALREVFDRMISDMEFEPRVEAPMPTGFPGPGPVGRVVVKEYPQYRAARADGGGAFWTLFQHIKKNDVAMTAPVEMTMDDGMRMSDMAFLYERTSQGEAGEDGQVDVLDLEPMKVMSIGMRGMRNAAAIERAKRVVESRLQAEGLEAAGSWRVLGYNSPMVPTSQRFWELQIPVKQ